MNDTILTGTHESAILTLITRLKEDFAMKDLGPLHYFLGLHAFRDKDGLYLTQSKYSSDLLHCAKMVGAKPYSAPTMLGSQSSRFVGDPLSDVSEHIVGSLQYCAISRPDISFSINQLRPFMHSPSNLHWTVAKRVLR